MRRVIEEQRRRPCFVLADVFACFRRFLAAAVSLGLGLGGCRKVHSASIFKPALLPKDQRAEDAARAATGHHTKSKS